MTDVIEFTTMLPLSACSPNWSGHWADKHRDKADYKSEVLVDCMVAIGRAYASEAEPWEKPADLPWPRARLSLTFGTQSRRGDGRYHPRDADNALAAFKAGIDGLVRAGVVEDDSQKHLELGDIEIDPTSYGVRVKLEHKAVEGGGEDERGELRQAGAAKGNRRGDERRF